MGSTTIAALIIIAVHLLVCMTLCLLHHVGMLKVDGLLLPFMAVDSPMGAAERGRSCIRVPCFVGDDGFRPVCRN